MTPTTTMPIAPSATTQSAEPTIEVQEQIRNRAYGLYERRGKIEGFASDDWFQAEAEILGARKQPLAKKAGASK